VTSLQRKILGVGLVVVALMCLVPPWERTISLSSTPQARLPLVYHLVFSPPEVAPYSQVGVRLDLGRLSIQLVSVAALCGALILAAAGRGKDGGT